MWTITYFSNPFVSHDPLIHLLITIGELAVFAVVVLVVTFFLSRWASTRMRRTLQATGLQINVSVLLARATWIAVWAAGLFVILYKFGVSPTPLAAFIGVLGLAASLSLQQVLQNLVAGIYLLAERPFEIGDVVAVVGPAGANHVGRVEDIQMRTTQLRGFDEELILVPNSSIFAGVITNRTQAGGIAEHVTLVLPRATNVQTAETGIVSMVEKMHGVLAEPKPELRVQSVTGDGWTACLTFWASDRDVVSRVIEALGTSYPDASVTSSGDA